MAFFDKIGLDFLYYVSVGLDIGKCLNGNYERNGLGWTR